jgi:hypothetical protein
MSVFARRMNGFFFVGFCLNLQEGDSKLNDEYNSISRRSSEPFGGVDTEHGINSLTVPLF